MTTPKTPPVSIRRVAQADWSTAAILLYGQPGVGKTRLAGAAPNPLILDIEGGCGALLGDQAEVRTLRGLDDLTRYLATESHPYDSIVFDGLDALYAKVRAAEMGDRTPRDRRQTHIEPSERMAMSLRNFLSLKLLKVVTAHSKREADPTPLADGEKARPPQTVVALPPALREVVLGLFDVVAYCSLTPGGARLLWPGGTTAFTKDRTGRLGSKALPLAWKSLAAPLGL